MIPEAFTPSQYAARCFREMSPAEKRHIVEHPDDGTAAETVDFFRCRDDLELTDSQVDSVALHLSELCQLRDIDYGTARKLNESGSAITSGGIVARHKNGQVIVAAADDLEPAEALAVCRVNLDQFCAEHGEGLDGIVCRPADFEFFRVTADNDSREEQIRLLTDGTSAELLRWLAWNDRDGIYLPSDCEREGLSVPDLSAAPMMFAQVRDGGEPSERIAETVVAISFCRRLREWLTREQMAQVIADNAAELDPSICHSHDVCDPNQAMIDTLESFGVTSIDVNDEPTMTLISDAWALAKSADFDPVRVQVPAVPAPGSRWIDTLSSAGSCVVFDFVRSASTFKTGWYEFHNEGQKMQHALPPAAFFKRFRPFVAVADPVADLITCAAEAADILSDCPSVAGPLRAAIAAVLASR